MEQSSDLDSHFSKHDESEDEGEVELTSQDRRIMAEFAKATIEMKDFQDACQGSTKEARAESKRLRDAIEGLMRAGGITCA